MQLASQLSPFRIVNAKNDLGLRLHDFPFGQIRTSAPTARDFAEVTLRRSPVETSLEVLISAVESEDSHVGIPVEAIVSDHDFFRSLAKILDTDDLAKVTPEVLLAGFLANIRCDEVSQTEWYLAVREWAASHDRTAFACPC
jgi:hypothetical protein